MEKREKRGKNKTEVLEDQYAETLVVIDGDFLAQCIQNDQQFYKWIYPDRKLDKIELANLCYEMLVNAQVIEAGKLFTFLIFHSQANLGFPFIKETFMDIDVKRITTENFSVEFYTIETETDERLFFRLNNFLESLNQPTETNNDRDAIIKKVLFCGDNPIYNEVVDAIYRSGNKEIVLIRKTYESKMNVDEVNYVNVDYLVGKALGLTITEL